MKFQEIQDNWDPCNDDDVMAIVVVYCNYAGWHVKNVPSFCTNENKDLEQIFEENNKFHGSRQFIVSRFVELFKLFHIKRMKQ